MKLLKLFRQIILFVLPNFNFCPSLCLPLKMFVRTTKIIHIESFKDKDSSIVIPIIVEWFCRVHLQVFLQPSIFDSQQFFANQATS